jgi:hypothetical protein
LNAKGVKMGLDAEYAKVTRRRREEELGMGGVRATLWLLHVFGLHQGHAGDFVTCMAPGYGL